MEPENPAALRAAELDKKDAQPCLLLARIYWEQGKRAEALKAVHQALDREPANAAAQSLLRSIEGGQGSLPRP